MVDVDKETSSEAQRRHLVDALREQGTIVSEPVAEAFLVVPREWFVPVFYEQERKLGHPWFPCTAALYEREEAWFEAVYRDKPLITLVDDQNRAVSSSSAPTAMALMLEALAVQPGMRVLEIGTGSGYNAALLAHLTGNPALVNTIDLEEGLAATAAQTLHEYIGPVVVHVGDGRLGVPLDRGIFDRVIATTSSQGIPVAWFEQLAVGGRLVMDLQGSLQQSSFLIIEKTTNDCARGSFDPRYLYFMPMRSPNDVSTQRTLDLLRQPVTQPIELLNDAFAETLFGNRSFLWLLQWMCPGLTLSRGRVTQGRAAGQSFLTITDLAKETMIQLFLSGDRWTGGRRGKTPLWQTINEMYLHWMDLGQPSQDAYSVEWDQQRHVFRLLLGQKPICDLWEVL